MPGKRTLVDRVRGLSGRHRIALSSSLLALLVATVILILSLLTPSRVAAPLAIAVGALLLFALVRLLHGYRHSITRLTIHLNADDGSIPVIPVGPTPVRALASALQAFSHRRREREQSLQGELMRSEQKIRSLESDLARVRDQVQLASKQSYGLLGLLSHNLRTPLQSLILATAGVSNRLADTADDSLKEDLNMIMERADHLLMIINQILKLAQLESGRESIKKEVCLLDDVIKSIRDTIAPLAQQGGNTLLTNNESSVKSIATDRDVLYQIAINLLGNACKYTQHGDIFFTLRCADGFLTMVVTDTGVGIKKEDLPSVFSAFFQARNNRPRRNSSGLGLAITDSMVRMMGGTIDILSEEGKGSTFTVTIPVNPHGSVPADGSPPTPPGGAGFAAPNDTESMNRTPISSP